MSKPEEKKAEERLATEEKKVSRRRYLEVTGGAIAGLVVGGALGYVAKPTVTAPPEVVTSTVTETAMGTVTATATSTATVAPVMPYQGITLKLVTQTGPFIAGPVYNHRDLWKTRTGGSIEVIEVPYSDLYSKVMTDFTTGTGAYDIVFGPAWAVPDWSAYTVPLDKYIQNPATNPNWDDIVDAVKDVVSWNGHVYGLPCDDASHLLYYNKLALENPDHQAKFKAKYGYDIPAANGWLDSITWKEYLDIAAFFNGWDWNGDGKNESGALECMARGTQTQWWFWDHTAPYSVIPGGPDKYRGQLYFDPDTMEPLVNQPGMVEGVTDFVNVTKVGPPGMLSMSVGETRAAFVAGVTALATDWEDPGVMSIDTKTSKIKGLCGFGQIPGATKIWDREKQDWIAPEWTLPPRNPPSLRQTTADHLGQPINLIPTLPFGGWVMFISNTCKYPDAAYDFAKFMDSYEISIQDVVTGSTGLNPYRKSHFASLKPWVAAGFTEQDARAYLDTMERNINSLGPTGKPIAMKDIYLPGSAKYVESVDINITTALAGEITPAKCCQNIYDEWQKITDDFGRDKQKAAYRIMMGMPP
jgi:multiple sugar transport system substrate-binding protein